MSSSFSKEKKPTEGHTINATSLKIAFQELTLPLTMFSFPVV